jgi:hypothetical protein
MTSILDNPGAASTILTLTPALTAIISARKSDCDIIGSVISKNKLFLMTMLAQTPGIITKSELKLDGMKQLVLLKEDPKFFLKSRIRDSILNGDPWDDSYDIRNHYNLIVRYARNVSKKIPDENRIEHDIFENTAIPHFNVLIIGLINLINIGSMYALVGRGNIQNTNISSSICVTFYILCVILGSAIISYTNIKHFYKTELYYCVDIKDLCPHIGMLLQRLINEEKDDIEMWDPEIDYSTKETKNWPSAYAERYRLRFCKICQKTTSKLWRCVGYAKSVKFGDSLILRTQTWVMKNKKTSMNVTAQAIDLMLTVFETSALALIGNVSLAEAVGALLAVYTLNAFNSSLLANVAREIKFDIASAVSSNNEAVCVDEDDAAIVIKQAFDEIYTKLANGVNTEDEIVNLTNIKCKPGQELDERIFAAIISGVTTVEWDDSGMEPHELTNYLKEVGFTDNDIETMNHEYENHPFHNSNNMDNA